MTPLEDQPNISKKWPRYPKVFEINTWVWLSDLSEKYAEFVDLGSVPPAEWDAITEFGFDGVWLMGVWERSPAGIAIVNRNLSLLDDFRRTLPDYHPIDNVGSPYCVRRYVPDELLGGPGGLAAARDELARRGIQLILDFVPNHVAPDHPWVVEHPEYFLCGTADDARNNPASYIELDHRVFACGRDPYFPAWPDVLQLNAFHAGLRQASARTLLSIAGQCDGVRCDMAMLALNRVFECTWAGRAGPAPETEYWGPLIKIVKQEYPEFLFIAEAYWGLEWELQQQGFDFCYDKRLYDRLEHDSPESVRLHLCADLGYQDKLVRFIENHDEPRAAASFSPDKERVVAVAIATLPGAKLFYEGQFEARKIRPPVFLARRCQEAVDQSMKAFYRKLMKAIQCPIFREGQWTLCERTGWPDNPSFQNLLCWSWVQDQQLWLIVVNLSERPAQARVHVPWKDIEGRNLCLIDLLSDATYARRGAEIVSDGLYVELGPFGYHFFRCVREGRSLGAVAG